MMRTDSATKTLSFLLLIGIMEYVLVTTVHFTQRCVTTILPGPIA